MARLQALLARDPYRSEALAAVAELALPDGWIAAGFVRDAVWDHLHGDPVSRPTGDVDVVWFCRDAVDKRLDRDMERRLRSALPHYDWSVKNQARMHHRNGDAPYGSVAEAMTHWPETATAVAARLDRAKVDVNAPLGLADLFGLHLRPTPAFCGDKAPIFDARIEAKPWLKRYPMLTVRRS